MKDKQVEHSSPQSRIPVISDVLHFVAMPLLVYLRSAFGFSYLRSKIVFITFSWAFLLFTAYAWLEPGKWRQFSELCIFGVGALTLYTAHLLIAFRKQLNKRGEHDYYSGTSHLARLLKPSQNVAKEKIEMVVQVFVEPALALCAGGIFRLVGWRQLSTWLFLAGICLCLKELQNYWSELRKGKIHEDILSDIPRTVEEPGVPETPPPKPTRKPAVQRARAIIPNPDEKHALTLRMIPPYELEQAETNYHALIKLSHSDTNQNPVEGVASAVELNAAIGYFREKSTS